MEGARRGEWRTPAAWRAGRPTASADGGQVCRQWYQRRRQQHQGLMCCGGGGHGAAVAMLAAVADWLLLLPLGGSIWPGPDTPRSGGIRTAVEHMNSVIEPSHEQVKFRKIEFCLGRQKCIFYSPLSVFPDIDKKTLPETIYGKTKNIAKVQFQWCIPVIQNCTTNLRVPGTQPLNEHIKYTVNCFKNMFQRISWTFCRVKGNAKIPFTAKASKHSGKFLGDKIFTVENDSFSLTGVRLKSQMC